MPDLIKRVGVSRSLCSLRLPWNRITIEGTSFREGLLVNTGSTAVLTKNSVIACRFLSVSHPSGYYSLLQSGISVFSFSVLPDA